MVHTVCEPIAKFAVRVADDPETTTPSTVHENVAVEVMLPSVEEAAVAEMVTDTVVDVTVNVVPTAGATMLVATLSTGGGQLGGHEGGGG